MVGQRLEGFARDATSGVCGRAVEQHHARRHAERHRPGAAGAAGGRWQPAARLPGGGANRAQCWPDGRDAGSAGAAEARLLSRAVEPADVDRSVTQRAVYDIGAARRALVVLDRAGAARAINDAIMAANQPVAPARPSPVAIAPSGVIVAPPPPPAPPPVRYALLPGHWQIRGATYVWVPPETRRRPVEDRPFVAGGYVWRDGAWAWCRVTTRAADGRDAGSVGRARSSSSTHAGARKATVRRAIAGSFGSGRAPIRGDQVALAAVLVSKAIRTGIRGGNAARVCGHHGEVSP